MFAEAHAARRCYVYALLYDVLFVIILLREKKIEKKMEKLLCIIDAVSGSKNASESYNQIECNMFSSSSSYSFSSPINK